MKIQKDIALIKYNPVIKFQAKELQKKDDLSWYNLHCIKS